MNILVQDAQGQWWKFIGVRDRLFEVHWAGEEFAVSYECFRVADAPLILGQSGEIVYGEKCRLAVK